MTGEQLERALRVEREAFAFAGDAAATDPACALCPHHAELVQLRTAALVSAAGLVRRGTRADLRTTAPRYASGR